MDFSVARVRIHLEAGPIGKINLDIPLAIVHFHAPHLVDVHFDGAVLILEPQVPRNAGYADVLGPGF